MKNKINYWKVATIVMVFIIVGILSVQVYSYGQNYKITNSQGLTFEISKANFEKLTNVLQDHQRIKIDDLTHKSEITVIKLN